MSDDEDLNVLLTFVDTKQISKSGEGLVHGNIETVRRYIREGILYAETDKTKGVGWVCRRGSVQARIVALNKLRNSSQRPSFKSLSNIGEAFKRVTNDDQFILSRLKQGMSPVDIGQEIAERAINFE
ncbi:MAG: hypothetical protein AB2657_10895 [Candidatus Thiodiazotropha endolucinida]